MAYTFGAATGDDINFAGLSATGLGADNCHFLITGWFYPTTLSPGRAYWGAGGTFGLEVDTTTSELRIKTANATTNGEWTTASAGITTGAWYFIAVLGTTETTGTLAAFRVWTGTFETPPVECTVSVAVAASGAFTGSATPVIGNKSAATTVAFQGDIDHLQWIIAAGSSPPVGLATSPLFLSTSGSITDDEAFSVLHRAVIPMWQGKMFDGRSGGVSTSPGWSDLFVWSGDQSSPTSTCVPKKAANNSDTGYGNSVAINGATYTAARGPAPRPESGVTNRRPRY
jgi:hypothetical protein